MNRRARVLLIVIVVAWATPGAASQGFRIHLPVTNAIVSGGGLVHVIVEIDPGVPPSAVRARHKEADLGTSAYRPRAAGGGVLHWTAQLAPGPNIIEVSLDVAGAPPVRETRVLFYYLPIISAEDPPQDFKRMPFHRADAEAACSECHRMQPLPSDAAPTSAEQSTCHACHSGLTKIKEVHGPAALWACTKCHDPTSASQRYATPEPVMPLCFSCHQEQKDRFYGNPYQHGPTATGYCTICHNPHGSEHGFFLKKAVFNLCTTCHFEKTGRHVISWGPTGQGHPLRGRRDPTRVNRELSCASCHNPHAAPAPRLWNFGATRWLDLCRNCHRDKLGG